MSNTLRITIVPATQNGDTEQLTKALHSLSFSKKINVKIVAKKQQTVLTKGRKGKIVICKKHNKSLRSNSQRDDCSAREKTVTIPKKKKQVARYFDNQDFTQ